MKATALLNSGLWPWMGLLAAWAGAFSLACRVDGWNAGEADGGGGGVLAHLLMSGRSELSRNFFYHADNYFHLGVLNKEEAMLAGRGDIFSRLRQAVRPSTHEHLEGSAVREMMFWLRAAVAADPGNIDMLLVCSYWLGDRLGQWDQVDEMLEEAQRRHPRDYRIYLERGRVFLMRARWDDAGRVLDAAARMWPSGLDESGDEQVRLDRARILTLRALLDQREGRIERAVARLRSVVAMFPARGQVVRWVEELESGEATPAQAEEQLRVLAKAPDPECHREAQEEHDDGHEEHDDGQVDAETGGLGADRHDHFDHDGHHAHVHGHGEHEGIGVGRDR